MFEEYFSSWWVFPLLVWVFAWKLVAAWNAARRGSKGWFVVILLINTFSIIPIFYMLMIRREECLKAKISKESVKKKTSAKKREVKKKSKK